MKELLSFCQIKTCAKDGKIRVSQQDEKAAELLPGEDFSCLQSDKDQAEVSVEQSQQLRQ